MLRLKFLFGILLYSGCTAVSLGSDVVCNERLFDAGQVEGSASYVKHDFLFETHGNIRRKIVRAIASCGCTSTFITESTITAQKPGVVNAVMALANVTGPKLIVIRIFFDDDSHIDCVLKARIKNDLKIDPDPLIFRFADMINGRFQLIIYRTVSQPDTNNSPDNNISIPINNGGQRPKAMSISVRTASGNILLAEESTQTTENDYGQTVYIFHIEGSVQGISQNRTFRDVLNVSFADNLKTEAPLELDAN